MGLVYSAPWSAASSTTSANSFGNVQQQTFDHPPTQNNSPISPGTDGMDESSAAVNGKAGKLVNVFDISKYSSPSTYGNDQSISTNYSTNAVNSEPLYNKSINQPVTSTETSKSNLDSSQSTLNFNKLHNSMPKQPPSVSLTGLSDAFKEIELISDGFEEVTPGGRQMDAEQGSGAVFVHKYQRKHLLRSNMKTKDQLALLEATSMLGSQKRAGASVLYPLTDAHSRGRVTAVESLFGRNKRRGTSEPPGRIKKRVGALFYSPPSSESCGGDEPAGGSYSTDGPVRPQVCNVCCRRMFGTASRGAARHHQHRLPDNKLVYGNAPTATTIMQPSVKDQAGLDWIQKLKDGIYLDEAFRRYSMSAMLDPDVTMAAWNEQHSGQRATAAGTETMKLHYQLPTATGEGQQPQHQPRGISSKGKPTPTGGHGSSASIAGANGIMRSPPVECSSVATMASPGAMQQVHYDMLPSLEVGRPVDWLLAMPLHRLYSILSNASHTSRSYKAPASAPTSPQPIRHKLTPPQHASGLELHSAQPMQPSPPLFTSMSLAPKMSANHAEETAHHADMPPNHQAATRKTLAKRSQIAAHVHKLLFELTSSLRNLLTQQKHAMMQATAQFSPSSTGQTLPPSSPPESQQSHPAPSASVPEEGAVAPNPKVEQLSAGADADQVVGAPQVDGASGSYEAKQFPKNLCLEELSEVGFTQKMQAIVGLEVELRLILLEMACMSTQLAKKITEPCTKAASLRPRSQLANDTTMSMTNPLKLTTPMENYGQPGDEVGATESNPNPEVTGERSEADASSRADSSRNSRLREQFSNISTVAFFGGSESNDLRFPLSRSEYNFMHNDHDEDTLVTVNSSVPDEDEITECGMSPSSTVATTNRKGFAATAVVTANGNGAALINQKHVTPGHDQEVFAVDIQQEQKQDENVESSCSGTLTGPVTGGNISQPHSESTVVNEMTNGGANSISCVLRLSCESPDPGNQATGHMSVDGGRKLETEQPQNMIVLEINQPAIRKTTPAIIDTAERSHDQATVIMPSSANSVTNEAPLRNVFNNAVVPEAEVSSKVDGIGINVGGKTLSDVTEYRSSQGQKQQTTQPTEPQRVHSEFPNACVSGVASILKESGEAKYQQQLDIEEQSIALGIPEDSLAYDKPNVEGVMNLEKVRPFATSTAVREQELPTLSPPDTTQME